MIKLPFNRATFARDMKPKISGNNLTLDYSNLESTLMKVAVQQSNLLSDNLYNAIVEQKGSEDTNLNAMLLDMLQRAMLHFCIYEHTIYLIANIGNDGITVKKSEDSTTIFKYQQDELSNKLVGDGWFWMTLLFSKLNENSEKIEHWRKSDQKKEYDRLPINIVDFNRWVGVDSPYFLVVSRWIIKEVWEERVVSRFGKDIIPPEFEDIVKRATCYEVMARTCSRLAYALLPEPIRRDLSNEMTKNHNAQADTHIRERISMIYSERAQSYWVSLDNSLARKGESIVQNKASSNSYGPDPISPKESFVL